jgi:protein-S-isoprenylcysteine O-methyltransferase Ste14
MALHLLRILAFIWIASELILTRRSGANATSKDRGSLTLLIIVQWTSIFLGIFVAYNVSVGFFPYLETVRMCGIGVFITGYVLRVYSIIYLGKFFTVNVAIASDHRVIDTGPYRYIRHPSYTGVFLLYLGLGLAIGNWLTMSIILIPIFIAFQWRMSIEEAALSEALGEPYREYMKRTKRLIPFIY